MLFDLKPKERIGDFFNYKEELNKLVGYLTDKNTKIIVVRGLRRTGKSSLVRVALHKACSKFVLIDVRELTSLSRKSFELKLLEELKSIKSLPDAMLEKIESIDLGVRIAFKSEEHLWPILKKLNLVIALDEVQMLRGTGVEAFCAAVYDNTNCKILLTGSEIGVLEEFLGKDDAKAPLFGRAYSEIKMQPLPVNKSIQFLETGFEEVQKKVPKETIAKAVEELDGIVGWLTMFGNTYLSSDANKALKSSITTGAKLAYSELESFLGMRAPAKKRYLTLLVLLAHGESEWGVLKRGAEVKLKEPISDSQFSNYLNSLVSYGFIASDNRRYFIPDPLLKKALRGEIK